MKIAIMQPYFMPYIGYFQLINSVDQFVIYDNIQFTKKGWINRNRILANGKETYISLPLKKDSDFLDVKDRVLAGTWQKERKKMLNIIAVSYKKAPFFNEVFPILEKIINFDDHNLFNFLLNSLREVLGFLKISTPVVVSSSLKTNNELKSQDKVIDICEQLAAKVYLNSIGGVELYNRLQFKQCNIELEFLKTSSFQYSQFKNEFLPWLSIIDVLMFNPVEEIKNFLDTGYEFI